jgi:predicted transcriptional regulator of viral defense system
MPYAFAYGSALALHGGTASERSEILISSEHSFAAFEHEGMAYRRAAPWLSDGCVRVTVGAEFVWTTTRERTLVDCVRVPANAGGIAEVLRGASALSPLRSRELLLWVDRYGEANLAARLGFVLEAGAQRLEQDELGDLLHELEQRRPHSKVYLERGTRGGKLLPRWNLIVAAHLLPTGIEAV